MGALKMIAPTIGNLISARRLVLACALMSTAFSLVVLEHNKFRKNNRFTRTPRYLTSRNLKGVYEQYDNKSMIKIRGGYKYTLFTDKDYDVLQQCAYMAAFGSYPTENRKTYPSVLDYDLFGDYHTMTNDKVKVYKKRDHDVYIFCSQGTIHDTKTDRGSVTTLSSIRGFARDIRKDILITLGVQLKTRMKTVQDALKQFLLSEAVTKDTKVYLAGHSLGGNITSDLKYNLQCDETLRNELTVSVSPSGFTRPVGLRQAGGRRLLRVSYNKAECVKAAYCFNAWYGLNFFGGNNDSKFQFLRRDPTMYACCNKGDIASTWWKKAWRKDIKNIQKREGISAMYLHFQKKPRLGGHSVMNFTDERWRVQYLHRLQQPLNKLGWLANRDFVREPINSGLCEVRKQLLMPMSAA